MNIRLLIVEDEELVAKSVVRILSDHSESVSFECTVAPTVAQCEVELSEIVPLYDEVLLDLNLPNGRGVATFMRVYAYTHKLRIPLIVMTADQFVRDCEMIRKGAQDFITKPLPPADIVIEKLHFGVLRYESVKETEDKYNGVLAGIRGMLDRLDGFPKDNSL